MKSKLRFIGKVLNVIAICALLWCIEIAAHQHVEQKTIAGFAAGIAPSYGKIWATYYDQSNRDEPCIVIFYKESNAESLADSREADHLNCLKYKKIETDEANKVITRINRGRRIKTILAIAIWVIGMIYCLRIAWCEP